MAQYAADRNLLTWRDNGVSKRKRIAVIIHTDESAVLENRTGSMRSTAWTADRLAEYNIEAPNDKNRGSYHMGVDRAGRAVRQNDDIYGTWSTGNVGNDICYHVCLTGTANQSREQWLSFGKQLDRAAEVVAHYCREYNIPARRVTPDMLKRGEGGIGGHWDCTKAWSNGKGHWDPGGYPDTNGGFPWDHFINLVQQKLAGVRPAPPTPSTSSKGNPVEFIRSLVNPAKQFAQSTLLALIDRATWEIRVIVNELARKNGIDPDAVVAEAIRKDNQ